MLRLFFIFYRASFPDILIKFPVKFMMGKRFGVTYDDEFHSCSCNGNVHPAQV